MGEEQVMKDRLILSVAIVVALACAGTKVAYAQLTAQITGTISDTTGAIIPEASVSVVNEDTGIKWDAKTNQDGAYTVPLLQPGNYRITVQRPGFRAVSRTAIRLQVAQTAKVDFTLEVGAAAESIEVTESAPL